MSYPSAFRAFTQSFKDYSSTIRRIDPMNRTAGFKGGDEIRLRLPSNALCALRTLKVYANGTTFSTADTNNKGYVALPPLLEKCLDRISVSLNGIVVQTTPSNYGRLVAMLTDYTLSAEERNVRRILNNEQLPLFTKLTGDTWGLEFTAPNDPAQNGDPNPATPDPLIARIGTSLYQGYRDANRKFVMSHFPGSFLSTSEPSVVSTAILGECVLSLHLAQASSCLTCLAVGGETRAVPTAGVDNLPAPEALSFGGVHVLKDTGITTPIVPVAPDFQLDNVWASIKTIDVGSNEFYAMLKSQVTDGGMDIVFTEFIRQPGAQTPNNATTNLGATVNSACVNGVYFTFEAIDDTAMTLQKDQNTLWTTPKSWPAGYQPGSYQNCQVPRAFQRGFIEDSVQDFTAELQVNNTTVNLRTCAWDAFANLEEELNLRSVGMNPKIENLEQWKKAYFVFYTRLNYKGAMTGPTENVRALSGFDSREAYVHLNVKTSGKTDGDQPVLPVMWIETTRTARIGAGQTLRLID